MDEGEGGVFVGDHAWSQHARPDYLTITLSLIYVVFDRRFKREIAASFIGSSLTQFIVMPNTPPPEANANSAQPAIRTVEQLEQAMQGMNVAQVNDLLDRHRDLAVEYRRRRQRAADAAGQQERNRTGAERRELRRRIERRFRGREGRAIDPPRGANLRDEYPEIPVDDGPPIRVHVRYTDEGQILFASAGLHGGGRYLIGQPELLDRIAQRLRIPQRAQPPIAGRRVEQYRGVNPQERGRYDDRNRGRYDDRNRERDDERERGRYDGRERGRYDERDRERYDERDRGRYDERDRGRYGARNGRRDDSRERERDRSRSPRRRGGW